jgi:hypothetical protein
MPKADRRSWPRELIHITFEWEQVPCATTRNMSAGGMYVLLPRLTPIEDWVSIDLPFTDARLRFRGLGQIVRVEPGAVLVGVAIRLFFTRLLRMP